MGHQQRDEGERKTDDKTWIFFVLDLTHFNSKLKFSV